MTTPATPPAFARPSKKPTPWARGCAALAGAMCGLIIALISCLVLYVFTRPHSPSWLGATLDTAGVVSVAAGAACGWMLTRRHSPYLVTVPCLLGWAGILVYVGHDEKPSDRFRLPEPSAQQLAGYDVLLWLSKDKTPHSRVGELSPLVQDELFASLPSDPSELRAHVKQHAASIRAAWQADTLGREWIERLAMMGPIAERSLAAEAPNVDFRPVRKVVYLRLSYAVLLLEEGDPEGAYHTLAPVIHFGHALGSARIHVHAGIGTVVTKQAYGVLQMLEPHLASHHRRSAEIMLNAAPPIHDRIYAVFAGDVGLSRAYLENIDWEKETGIRSVMLTRLQAWRLFFHPQRTLNELAALYDSMLPAISARDFAKADSYAEAFVTSPLRGRNLIGTLVQRMMLPATEKHFRAMWQVEDHRLALLGELRSR